MSVPKPAAGMAPEPCRSGISHRSAIGRINHEKTRIQLSYYPPSPHAGQCLSIIVSIACGHRGAQLRLKRRSPTSDKLENGAVVRRGGAVGRCGDAEGSKWRGGLVTAEDVRTVQLRPASPVVH